MPRFWFGPCKECKDEASSGVERRDWASAGEKDLQKDKRKPEKR